MILRILVSGAAFLVVLLVLLRISMESLTARRAKILALFAMGVLPMFWLLGTLVHAVDSMEKVEFCIQCHTMTDHGKSLHVEEDEDDTSLVAAHFQNNRVHRDKACYECHVVHTPAGIMKSKINGLREAYIEYLGTPREKLEMSKPYQTVICLRCHGEAKNFLDVHDDPEELKDLLTGKTSCVKECHDVVHNLGKKKDE